jgi:hypothetical protein
MVARAQRFAKLTEKAERNDDYWARQRLKKGENKLPGINRRPYGEVKMAAAEPPIHRWIAPQDRAMFPRPEGSLDTSEKDVT